MRVCAKVGGELYLVPCGGGSSTIRWLGEEAVRRYTKQLRDGDFNGLGSPSPPSSAAVVPPTTTSAAAALRYRVRKAASGALLDLDDLVKDVLDDDDTVAIVIDGEAAWTTGLGSRLPEPCPAHHINGVHSGPAKVKEQWIELDGACLSTEDVMKLGSGHYGIKLSPGVEERVAHCRRFVDKIVESGKVVYGINTGFGQFANTVIPRDKLSELQVNLIRSHAAGVGAPLPPDKVRRFLALRINVLAKGYSGVSPRVLQQLVDAFNNDCLPLVPEKGTVGASGDLAPLSHMALGLMGEGRAWSPVTGWASADEVLQANGLEPIKLGPKEGLALINGTQFICAIGVEAAERAATIAREADVVTALSLEVLKGTTRAFDADIHKARPHKGQKAVARRLRALLHSSVFKSEIAESHRQCGKVQDAYTLRCCPQVHGVVHDTIEFVRRVLTVEINSATDNPMIFADREESVSGGNFHGEYPAKVLDYLAIGIHEIANMSERRTERLVNKAYSGLPAFLVSEGGLNSGFMIAHCTAAALVSENKVLCHPSSVDSLSTSAGTEDHVSMGGCSARKALQVVEHVEQVIAIELLAACQAIEFLRPLRTTKPLEEVVSLVRSVARPWDRDRYMAPDIEAVTLLLREDRVWKAVEPYISEYASSEMPPESAPPSPSGYSWRDPQGDTLRRRERSSDDDASLLFQPPAKRERQSHINGCDH